MAQIKVNEVLGLVRHIAAKVAADDAVPCGIVLFVELLLDVSGNILLNVVLLQGLGCAVNSVLLHVFRHISVLNDGLMRQVKRVVVLLETVVVFSSSNSRIIYIIVGTFLSAIVIGLY